MKDRFAAVGVKTLVFLIVLLAIPAVSNAQSAKTQDAFVGAVEKIDAEAKLVYVRSKMWGRKGVQVDQEDDRAWDQGGRIVGR